MMLDYDGFFGWWSDDRRLVMPPGCWRNWAIRGCEFACCICQNSLVCQELSNLNSLWNRITFCRCWIWCAERTEQSEPREMLLEDDVWWFWVGQKNWAILNLWEMLLADVRFGACLKRIEHWSGLCWNGFWQMLHLESVSKRMKQSVASCTWWILSVCLKKWISNQIIIQSWTPERSCLSAGDVGFSNNASRLLSNLVLWIVSCAVGCWIQQSHEIFFQAIWSIVKILQTF
jgi:hypothetical protein